MDSLMDLPGKLASGLIALALILLSLQGPPKGPSARMVTQMSFPVMISQLAKKQRGHPILQAAASRLIRKKGATPQ